ncbi:MAG: AbgT family transporter, partial [Bacteroidales bacterium]
LLCFTIIYLVIGVLGFNWYITEISALFMALAIFGGIASGLSANGVVKEFINGAKDIFSAAFVVGLAAGIIIILEDGKVINTLLNSVASSMEGSSKVTSLGLMYGIQTMINLVIPSASAKAAITMPIMAPFSDLIGVSRQATVLAFQFGDGFTNMITPTSGVLIAVLGISRIPYGKWVKFIWKFIIALIIIGFILLLPTVFINLVGF